MAERPSQLASSANLYDLQLKQHKLVSKDKRTHSLPTSGVLRQEGCGLGQRGEGLGGAGVDRAMLIQHISTALQMQTMLQTNRAPDAHSFTQQMYPESLLHAGEEEARMAGLPARSMPASGGPVRLPGLL